MWEKRLKTATGRDAFIIKKAIIDLRKDQYIIKNAYRKPVVTMHASHATHYTPLNYSEEMVDGEIKYSGAKKRNVLVVTGTGVYVSSLEEPKEYNFKVIERKLCEKE